MKSLYYCRSKSVSRAAFAGTLGEKEVKTLETTQTDYEECLACQ